MEEAMLKRWRLILGDAKDEQGKSTDGTGLKLEGNLLSIDKALGGLYDKNLKKGGAGSGASQPRVHRWLGDIRQFFPVSVVQMMQKDAIERLNLTSLLTEKEMLEEVVPDVNLVATLVSLGRAIPEESKETARLVVRKVVDELMKKLEEPMRQSVTGALSRSIRNYNPKYREIDWPRTILKNLKHYQKEYRTVIPETLVGNGRKGQSLKDIILCIDQSGSMGTSVVYSAIFGAVLASLPAVSTTMVVFDTAVVDLTAEMQDPVDLLFGVQLGGGTDIDKALAYCQSKITRPEDTVLVLISDLYENGDQRSMLSRMKAIVDSGVNMVTLLALNDEGAPFYDEHNAQYLESLGVSAFACTPDLFPDLMGVALKQQDVSMWVAENVKQTEKN